MVLFLNEKETEGKRISSLVVKPSIMASKDCKYQMSCSLTCPLISSHSSTSPRKWFAITGAHNSPLRSLIKITQSQRFWLRKTEVRSWITNKLITNYSSNSSVGGKRTTFIKYLHFHQSRTEYNWIPLAKSHWKQTE